MERAIRPGKAATGGRKDYLQRRARSMGVTMMVMGASFALYYLGLFGGVTGPLEPGRMGAALAEMGVGRAHVPVILLALFIVAVSWNWLYNLGARIAGTRLRCTGPGESGAGPCGVPVRREGAGAVYACPRGHRRPDARFHPMAKGPVSHCLWVTALGFFIASLVAG